MERATREPAWDLYRTFEALARKGTFSEAARALGITQSTASRHIKALEAHAGARLVERTTPVALTERGRALAAVMEPMLQAAQEARGALTHSVELSGTVTIATVGELVRWVLAPRLPELFMANPGIRLHLLAGNHTHSLAANEADIAIRMARPESGDLVARRLSQATYGLFAAASLPLSESTPWLGLGGSLARIAEQRHAARMFKGRAPRLLVEEVDALGLAVEAGLGCAVLPLHFPQRLTRVVEITPRSVGAAEVGPLPSRTIWMVVHRAKKDEPSIKVVMAWLSRIFAP